MSLHRRPRRLSGIVALLAAAGLALAAPSVRPAPSPTADASRELLVMLRLPPGHLRATADYAGAYGDGPDRAARRRVASRIARDNGLILVDDWPMPIVGMHCFVMAVPAGRSPDEMAARLSSQAGVEWSEPMSLYHARAAPPHNDALFLAQPAAHEWRLADLHRVSTGRAVRVAVIDSRVDVAHPDLAGQVELSRDFVGGHGEAPEQHGTAVAGVIAARADNRLGIAGVAPGARLLALRACWQASPAPGLQADTACDTLSLAKALEFAVAHRAQVINLSLSGPPDRLLAMLLDVAERRRIAIVGAYDPRLPGGGFPASHPGVVAVADESSGARRPGVYDAPGSDIPTTFPGGRWSLVSGSSFSAAHVSGLIALVLARRPASSARLTLVSAGRSGGAIDACATLGAGKACACLCSAAADRPSIARR